MYKRILLKLSGEQLAGEKGQGIDPSFIAWLAEEIKQVVAGGVQVAVVIGGGNWLRGASFAGEGLQRANADYMGMLATIMNGVALMDLLESHGCMARLMTNIRIEQVAEPFIRRRAIRHLEKGRVVIIGGGTGKPFVTTDTAAVSSALELDCEVVLKATKVDGVYDKDPMQHQDAKRFESMEHQTAIQSPTIRVMDKAAIGLALEQKMPIIVFNLHEHGNLLKVAQGEKIGTTIS